MCGWETKKKKKWYLRWIIPSLSYRRKASFNSFCMASASSSTMNLAAKVTNSSNSKRPDSVIHRNLAKFMTFQTFHSCERKKKHKNILLSASTSSINSSRILLLKGCPMRRRISATISVGIDPDFWLSKASNAFFNTIKKSE